MTLTRGTTYTFTVEAGPTHPFYITSDAQGGRSQKTAAEKQAENVYAGVQNANTASEAATGGLQTARFLPDSRV